MVNMKTVYTVGPLPGRPTVADLRAALDILPDDATVILSLTDYSQRDDGHTWTLQATEEGDA